MIKERCDKCRYWEPLNLDCEETAHVDDKSGMCHRYPATLDLSEMKDWIVSRETRGLGYSYLDSRYWNQPVTEGDDWCGEFKPNK